MRLKIFRMIESIGQLFQMTKHSFGSHWMEKILSCKRELNRLHDNHFNSHLHSQAAPLYCRLFCCCCMFVLLCFVSKRAIPSKFYICDDFKLYKISVFQFESNTVIREIGKLELRFLFLKPISARFMTHLLLEYYFSFISFPKKFS